MKVSDLNEMTKDELVSTIGQLRDEHFKLRLRRGSEELPNPLRLRVIRRDIARIMTMLREIELGRRTIVEKKTMEKKTADKEPKVAREPKAAKEPKAKKTKERTGAKNRA